MVSNDIFSNVTSYFENTKNLCNSQTSHNIQAPGSTISFIVIGAGLIGPRHAEHVQARSDCKLMAIVDHSAKGPSVAEKYNCLLFKSLQELFDYCEKFNQTLPDAAIIATPNHTHLQMSLDLASKGIHILVEKPLASNATDCKTLINYCEYKQVKLLVGHHRRFNPYIITTKENMPRVGKLVAIQGTWTICKPPSYFLEKPWRSTVEKGGGTLLINLIHDLDLLQYLIGPIEKVYAELLCKQRTDRFDDNQTPEQELVDEGAALTLKFANGCCGTFVCSDNVTSPFSFEVGTGENPTIPFNNDVAGFYRIFGSHGTISVPDLKLYHQNDSNFESISGNMLTPYPSPDYKIAPIHHMHMGKKPKPFDLQLEHFVNLITGRETEVKCTGEDALRALLCIEAVMKSIETGMPQYVESMDSIQPDYDMLNRYS
ncbi:putative oxidoreductase [Spathaspora passalidarum NRRL Y-27907]|uniref:Putative oxidoreductase n=1 Tax=Spathaspora passalidarum (strain NRRL Y-27907 / 11-Y1) TaxID=619300 RepID=G3AQ42_SPAPN|nr:putative oxidoreductase [Spathaspora passalidarum NRRL Y-27907]EGW31389.1 putative oxidoreductase [Spathaspora passalidarum NRRL Y-27907]